MTAAGIALLLGGLAILLGARRLLWPAAEGRRRSGRRAADRRARRGTVAALPAAPVRVALTAGPARQPAELVNGPDDEWAAYADIVAEPVSTGPLWTSDDTGHFPSHQGCYAFEPQIDWAGTGTPELAGLGSAVELANAATAVIPAVTEPPPTLAGESFPFPRARGAAVRRAYPGGFAPAAHVPPMFGGAVEEPSPAVAAAPVPAGDEAHGREFPEPGSDGPTFGRPTFGVALRVDNDRVGGPPAADPEPAEREPAAPEAAGPEGARLDAEAGVAAASSEDTVIAAAPDGPAVDDDVLARFAAIQAEAAALLAADRPERTPPAPTEAGEPSPAAAPVGWAAVGGAGVGGRAIGVLSVRTGSYRHVPAPASVPVFDPVGPSEPLILEPVPSPAVPVFDPTAVMTTQVFPRIVDLPEWTAATPEPAPDETGPDTDGAADTSAEVVAGGPVPGIAHGPDEHTWPPMMLPDQRPAGPEWTFPAVDAAAGEAPGGRQLSIGHDTGDTHDGPDHGSHQDGEPHGEDDAERAGQHIPRRRITATRRTPGKGDTDVRQRVTHPRAEARRRLTAATEVIPAVSELTAILPTVTGEDDAGEGRPWEPGRPRDAARSWDGEGTRPRPRPRPRPTAQERQANRSNVYVSRHAAD